jgi:hypothetical protein
MEILIISLLSTLWCLKSSRKPWKKLVNSLFWIELNPFTVNAPADTPATNISKRKK